ncbi:MAG TPA: phosphomannomutase/phosphoglucomutase [Acidimicrobiia bacterium]|nr:phosphomannomutase/phosphoglucomutase [Acidimicrobiia bacterium]
MDPKTVFKAYDIRGRTDNGELTPELLQRVGAAFVSVVEAKQVAIGRDCRLSSPSLFDGLVTGITGAGADVVDLGEVPTDLVYYYSGAATMPGAMITASHNPPQYNGLKLCREMASPVGADTGLNEIRDRVLSKLETVCSTTGTVTTVEAVDAYVDHLLSIVEPSSLGRMRVAVDGGNGMAGVTVSKVFARIDSELDGLYLEPDGTFPNHPADPIQPENLADLVERVSHGGHDLGVAFDGDADRAFFIDDHAEAVSGSTVTALIARWMLARHPGASIIHNLITSRAVPEVIGEAGGKAIRTRVGHSYIKEVMAQSDAVFGGEHSGHYYFRDNFRADSGMLAMLVLMRVITDDGRPLSGLRRDVERYAASGEINLEVHDPLASIEMAAEAYGAARQDRLDGLSVDLGWAWFNLRASNTEPLLRLNVEAPEPDSVEELVTEIATLLEE